MPAVVGASFPAAGGAGTEKKFLRGAGVGVSSAAFFIHARREERGAVTKNNNQHTQHNTNNTQRPSSRSASSQRAGAGLKGRTDMSRIGKLPVAIPAGVKVGVERTGGKTAGVKVSVEGPKGKLSKVFAPVVEIKVEGAEVRVTPLESSRFAGAMHGTARAIIKNMVTGVTQGYSKKLEIEGVGFKATLKGNVLDLALGYSHPILYTLPAGIKVDIQEGTKVEISGADKEAVGKVAAEVKSYYPVEPYKGKGVRLVGQFVRRKEGKKTA